MKKIIVVLISLMLIGCSKMEVLTNTMLAADGYYTVKMLKDPNYHESNVVLGPYPHKDKVIGYFAGSIFLNSYLHRKLKGNWLKSWQFSLVVVEADCLYRFYKFGFMFEH